MTIQSKTQGKHQLLAYVLVLSFLWSLPQSVAQSHSDAVSVDLVQVCSHFSANDTNDNEAVAEIVFHNTSDHALRIPMAGLFGNGVPAILKKAGIESKPPYYNKGTLPSPGGTMAKIYYRWESTDGKIVVSGIYEVSIPEFKLQKLGQNYLLAPIKIPNRGGQYKLQLRFDNRQLKLVTPSFSYTDPGVDCVFLEAAVEADINLP